MYNLQYNVSSENKICSDNSLLSFHVRITSLALKLFCNLSFISHTLNKYYYFFSVDSVQYE